jgi:hypothetical protein
MFDSLLGAVRALPAGDLVNHLIGMVPNLPDDARSELASTVLGALGQNGSSPSDVADAGVPVEDAQHGDHAALGALLEHATQNPDALRDAAVSYIKNNPGLIEQYAPAPLKGILSQFGV